MNAKNKVCPVCRARPSAGHLLCDPCLKSSQEAGFTHEDLILWAAERAWSFASAKPRDAQGVRP